MAIKKMLQTVVLALCGASIFISCAQPTDSPEVPNNNQDVQENTQDEITIKNVKENLTIQNRVVKNVNKIILPTEKDGVTISWKSDNADVITAEGNVTHKDDNVTVKLTATLKLKELTAEKKFDVIVYGINVKLTDNEILDAALSDSALVTFAFDENNIQQSVQKQFEKTYENKVVQFSLENALDSDNITDTGADIIVSQDLVSYDARFNVTAKINNGPSKTSVVTYNIPRITKFIIAEDEYDQKIVEFSDKHFEVKTNSKEPPLYGRGAMSKFIGRSYSYSVNAVNKTIDVECINLISSDGSLKAVDDDVNISRNRELESIAEFNEFKQTATYVAYNDYKSCNGGLGDDDPVLDLGSYLPEGQKIIVENGNVTPEQINNFMALPEETKNAAVAALINSGNVENIFKENHDGLSSTEYEAYVKSDKFAEKYKKAMHYNKMTYKYVIKDNKLAINAIFDKNLKWYEQDGVYIKIITTAERPLANVVGISGSNKDVHINLYDENNQRLDSCSKWVLDDTYTKILLNKYSSEEKGSISPIENTERIKIILNDNKEYILDFMPVNILDMDSMRF